jgi:hypothetical protein
MVWHHSAAEGSVVKVVAVLNVWHSADGEMVGLGVMVSYRGSLFDPVP